MTNRERYDGLTIEHMDDQWRVIGVGSEEDGLIFCHLMSLTRGRHQRNGYHALQINDWIEQDVLDDAASEAESVYGPWGAPYPPGAS